MLCQVIETNGQQYLMLNLLNSGFEHSVKVAVDGHEMIVVANDGGFVEPYTTHVSSAATQSPMLYTFPLVAHPPTPHSQTLDLEEPKELTDTA